MRLFIGVELEETLRVAAAAAARLLEERLRRSHVNLDVRWIPQQNLHVTLWFIGEATDEQTARIADALRGAWEIPPFPMSIAGVGAFPSARRPGILWLGITRGADELVALYSSLATRLGPLGIQPERRPYHPHITIGRVKQSNRAALKRKAGGSLPDVDAQVGSTDVRAITLFQSRLSRDGSQYTPLLRVPLMGC